MATKQKQKSTTTTPTREYVDFNSPTYRNFRAAFSRELILAGVDSNALQGKTGWFTSNNVEQMLALKKKHPKIFKLILKDVVDAGLTMRIGNKGLITLEK